MARTRLGRTLPETVGVHGAIEHSAPAITFDRVNVAYGRGRPQPMHSSISICEWHRVKLWHCWGPVDPASRPP